VVAVPPVHVSRPGPPDCGVPVVIDSWTTVELLFTGRPSWSTSATTGWIDHARPAWAVGRALPRLAPSGCVVNWRLWGPGVGPPPAMLNAKLVVCMGGRTTPIAVVPNTVAVSV
jgi:hypothetical protein